MRRSVITSLLVSAALIAGSFARADEPAIHRYELPNLDTLELGLPAGWVDHVDQPAGGGPPTIELGPAEGAAFQVFVTPEWMDPSASEIRETPALRDAIRDAAERIKPQVVESFLEVRQLNGVNGIGYYFAATDRDPRADEFKYMSQGLLQVGDLTLWFTILTNDGQDTVAVEALTILQTAVHRRTGLDRR
ncbi:MAG TPA: hypothetical protein VGA24_06565 [Steroidobacteraceae bacterium]